METLKCILCESSNITISEILNTNDISNLYKKRADVEVKKYFSSAQISVCSCNLCGLKFYNPLSVGDGQFYDELQKYDGYYLKEKAEFKEAAKYITSGDNVLEIGCGEGLFTNYISYKSYSGLEFSTEAIKTARQRGLYVINQDLTGHAYQNPGAYDVVCYFQVLEHVENPKKFIADSLTCLKEGGLLIFAVPSEDSFIQNAINFYLNMPPHHTSKWPDKTFNYLTTLYHLELLSIYHEPLNDIHNSFYSKTKVNTSLRNFFGLKFRSIDTRLLSKLIYIISLGISYLSSLSGKPRKKIGQSVMVVYRKLKQENP